MGRIIDKIVHYTLIVGALGSTVFDFLIFYVWATAYTSPTYSVLITVNRYNEANLESIVVPIFLVFVMIANFIMLKKIISDAYTYIKK